MSGASLARVQLQAATPDIDHLWMEYRRGQGVDQRNRLAERYQGFARMMAAKAYARRTSSDTEFDDYLQYANLGLLESIERYDPDMGAKFETYAAIRINGAILNGLESETELHRQLAARRRLVAERTAMLREAEPVAEDTDVFARLADIAMGLAIGFMLEGSGMVQEQEEGGVDNTYASIELRQLGDQLGEAIDELAEKQRYVVAAHYLQRQAFDEIAAALQLSRGRVSQLHKEALLVLRARLRRRFGVDFSC